MAVNSHFSQSPQQALTIKFREVCSRSQTQQVLLPGTDLPAWRDKGMTTQDERGKQTTSAQHSPRGCQLTHLCFVKMFKSGNVLFPVLPDSSFIHSVYYLGYTTWYHKKNIYSKCMKIIIVNLADHPGPRGAITFPENGNMAVHAIGI